MATIDLKNCFPEAADGTRGPLPKQALFLQKALEPGGAKYIRYLGGIGSGKTMIGCITVLTWCLLHPGDYLIARQFYPELRATSYRTFLEICPPELILEHRVADMMVVIKSANGKKSTIFFRPLEDADKLRSLNLSGFMIDEASQVGEEAFLLLQGRLRGPGLRKGILTTNSGGRNYLWRYFVKKDFKSEEAKKLYFNIKAPSTENKHLPAEYVESMLLTWSEQRIRREIEGDEDSFEGQVYSEFSRITHVIQPFAIPKDWTRFVGADAGYRNPAAWVWCAQDYDGNVYVYREFYKREWLIEEIVKGNRKTGEPGVVALSAGETIEQIRIDPSTKATRALTGGSDFDAYLELMPRSWALMGANNEVSAGIDKVKTYLKVDPRTGKPRLFIFNTCENLIDEMSNYRYQETPANQLAKANEKEQPVKKDDHAEDALRYAIMSRPELPLNKESLTKGKYPTANSLIQKEWDEIKNPKPADHFKDI
jgi:PBSX family phage terminase large subunit